MSPYEVDKLPYFEVIDLYSETREIQIESKPKEQPKKIRRPAGDDWF